MEPFEKYGEYWGYQVRVASSVKAIFDESPYDGGYDLKINSTKAGTNLEHLDIKKTH